MTGENGRAHFGFSVLRVDPAKGIMDIDEDVMKAAIELALIRKSTAGRVLSELARRGLQPRPEGPSERNGVPLLPSSEGEGPVTREIVARLREED